MDQPKGVFYLGEIVDPATHERTGEPVHLDADKLTTHGVIVGMTGSGKTGLGIVLLEEALLSGVPALILDPKGDMGNLLLGFPDFAPERFEPWVSPAEAEQEGVPLADLARQKAELWQRGLAGWGIDGDRLRALHAKAEFTLYTPGSTAGVPLNVVGSLKAPASAADIEATRDEIEGFVSSLLGLVGIAADPIASREHILLSNLIEHAWTQGQDLDLAALVLRVTDPPIRRLGVFELDSFFPAKDRMALAMRLNGLIASPSFVAWTEGPDLDLDTLLRSPNGAPRAAIVSLAHLSDEERQFVVTLLLSKTITWMRGQRGTTDLRALIYMDEVFGYAPPTAAPPSKKPILTILKQARAFGVGMVLSTQNPVDIDYKALSNTGTWMIGRLQTERDKARLMDGLRSAAGDVDIEHVEATISGLGKREFLLQTSGRSKPEVFGTRWAMSYLAGPLTRGQIGTLTADHRAALAAAPTPDSGAQPEPPPPAHDETPAAPKVASGIPVYHLHPSSEWAAQFGASSAPGSTFEAALAVRINLLFDDTKADLRQTEEWEAIVHPITDPIVPASAVAVDYDARDFSDQPPHNAPYRIPDVALDASRFFSDASSRLVEHLYVNRSLEVLKNEPLKLYSRIGEPRSAFQARCEQAADVEADKEAAKLRGRVETQIKRAQAALSKAEDRVEELEADTRARRGQEFLAGAGDLLGAFLGGKRRTRGLAGKLNRMASRRSMTSRTAQRLDTAENRVGDKLAEIETLEHDLADALIDISDRWDAHAREISELDVTLEKNDIDVAEVAVVWIPIERT